MKQQIRFYDKNNQFGALANTANLKVEFSLNGNIIKALSSECIYQAVKGILNPNVNYQQLGQDILNGQHGYARSVQIAGQGFNSSDEIKVIHKNINSSPEELKYYIMRDIVKAKLTQHPVLMKALVDKVNAGYEIVEDAPTDFYWGIGNNGTGQNKLGQILTEVATELNLEMQQNGKFKVCNSFSPETAKIIKDAGLIEPKAANIADKFVDITNFNNLPNNCTTEFEIANYYNSNNNIQTNNNQKSSTIDAIDMKNLANELVMKGQFGKFVTQSGKGVKVEYEVNQNSIVIIETLSRNTAYKIEYNTKAGTVTENGIQVPNSGLGDWAFGIVKHHAEKNISNAQITNSNHNSNNSQKINLIPVNNPGDYKDFFKQLIAQEPDCKFTVNSKSTPLTVIIKHDQGIIIQGTDNKGQSITVKELVDSSIFENGNSVAGSSYLGWAMGPVGWALSHSEQINVEALGAGDYN